MKYKINIASEIEKNELFNIMQIYYKELSKYQDETAIFETNEKGIYESKYFDCYWTDKDRFPYLLKQDEKIIGFAFVRKNEENYIEIAEFFILNEYKSKGLGSFMAKNLFDLHKGNWEIRTLLKNKSAQTFWRKIISEYTNDNYEEKYIRNNTRLAWYFANK